MRVVCWVRGALRAWRGLVLVLLARSRPVPVVLCSGVPRAGAPAGVVVRGALIAPPGGHARVPPLEPAPLLLLSLLLSPASLLPCVIE